MRKFEITYRRKSNNGFVKKIVIESENDLGVLFKGHMKLNKDYNILYDKYIHDVSYQEITDGVYQKPSKHADNLANEINELETFADINRCAKVLLKKVQEHVLGYHKNPIGEWECVVSNNGEIIKTFQILRSFGLSNDHFHINNQNIALFPDGKSLSDMLTDPIGFSEWTEKYLT